MFVGIEYDVENEEWEYLSDGSDVEGFFSVVVGGNSDLKCAAFNPSNGLFYGFFCEAPSKGICEISKRMRHVLLCI